MLMDTSLSLFAIQLLTLLSFIPKLPAGATSITHNPDFACEGESIRVSCVLTPPKDGDIITSIEMSFIIGDTNGSISRLLFDNSNIVHGFNLSRFVVDAPSGNVTHLTGSITLLAYDSSTDEGLRIGCSGSIRRGGASMLESFIQTVRLLSSAPSSAPSLQSSVSNFNTATCSANISLSWNTPPSDKTVDRYFLYLNESILATTNSNSYIHSTILNINTDYQYSVTAMNCIGNSTNSSSNVSVASYSLMRSSQFVCLVYYNVTGALTVNWSLSTPTQPSGVSGLDISYSLQLLYSHSRQGVTYPYTDSTSFTLPSSQLSYNTTITPHNFTQLDGVETDITANLMIVQQCGQSFNGTTMECFFNSNNPPTILTTTTPPTTSISRNATFSTLTSTTANTTNTTLSITIIIIGSTVGGVSFVVILSTPTFLFVLLVIFLSKKKKNEEHTGTDGSGVKNYKELGEDTYSQVNKKPPKHKPEPVKKDQCELNYLEIDHSSGTGKIVKPPIIPKTNYADINSFPQETQYASLQN